jgi:hypothetical protein
MELFPKTMEIYGSIRITNPKTLQNWIDRGWYQELIEEGWIFSPYCGRFRKHECECSKCRYVAQFKNKESDLKEVLKQNNLMRVSSPNITELKKIELVEKSWKNFQEQYLPKKNPQTQGVIFPDILKHNPEHCTKEDKRKRVWSVLHRDNDIYAVPGIKRSENFLGLIFTKVPHSDNSEIAIL